MTTALLAAMMMAAAVPAADPGAATPAPAASRDVVLVHGATMDGSGWRGVHDALHRKGYRVVVAQLPLTGVDADVEAVRQVLDRTKGQVVLVGHSYGGAVISVAGNDPRVRSLVYVAAHQPDEGESVAELNARFPSPAHVDQVGNGAIIVAPKHFAADVAADLPAEQAAFLAQAQRPTATSAFTTKLTAVAWRAKPVWAIVANQDRTLSPHLERWMYARSNARVTALDASHVVHISRAKDVAKVIEAAATGE